MKWMPPYWVNKTLPTPTLTLPDNLFSTFSLFPSFLLKINAFPMRYEIWKGRKKSLAKGGCQPALTASKNMHLTICTTETDYWPALFIVDYPNHKLVGGVIVNNLNQQSGLFALSVNRHSGKEMSTR